MNTNLLSQTYQAPPGHPSKSRNIPPKEFGFRASRDIPNISAPHPFAWETPTPPEDIRTQKFGFVLSFLPDLFLRRFREGISFPKSLERSILRLPLSKLCAVPFALQNRALFEGGEKGEKVPRKGEEREWPAKGQKGKKDARKQVSSCLITNQHQQRYLTNDFRVESDIF